MAKRPTIGNNPLDALMPESHLDAVVPDLLTSPPQEKAPLEPKGVEEPRHGQAAWEAENQALRQEVEKLKEQVEELKNRLAQAEPRWVTLRRLGGN
jgi:polyhydroxyalkanoate synthesis regulator phasin